ncbi:MAG: hypothetical protein ACUZ77_12305 [Candidatus Brocadiales bacterium]
MGASSDAVNDGRIVESELERVGVSLGDIANLSLRKNKKFVFILDGYDELELTADY